jgi:hypothetical protein
MGKKTKSKSQSQDHTSQADEEEFDVILRNEQLLQFLTNLFGKEGKDQHSQILDYLMKTQENVESCMKKMRRYAEGCRARGLMHFADPNLSERDIHLKSAQLHADMLGLVIDDYADIQEVFLKALTHTCEELRKQNLKILLWHGHKCSEIGKETASTRTEIADLRAEVQELKDEAAAERHDSQAEVKRLKDEVAELRAALLDLRQLLILRGTSECQPDSFRGRAASRTQRRRSQLISREESPHSRASSVGSIAESIGSARRLAHSERGFDDTVRYPPVIPGVVGVTGVTGVPGVLPAYVQMIPTYIPSVAPM